MTSFRPLKFIGFQNTTLVAIFVLVGIHAFGQTAGYTIYSADKELLGQLKVSSIQADTTTKIAVVSQFKIKMLITIDVKYTLQSFYRNGELVSNSIKMYRNDELHSFAKTTKVGSQYKFIKDENESIYDKRISFSESLLYFNEPIQISTIYSEFDGVEKTIIESSKGHYKIKNPLNGNESEYFYEKGTLSSAIVHFQMMTLYLVKDIK
ncbi:MAG: hypothetical protein IPG07_07260 [Crocinitomicaceae bacterium]|nr:hypothetical protein [Crocinitomicaceae bacterium]